MISMSIGEDLAALVRSVFVLTQCTFSPVETVAELDFHMRLQWRWGDALDAALRCDYKAVEMFLATGKVASADAAAFAALDISGGAEKRYGRKKKESNSCHHGLSATYCCRLIDEYTTRIFGLCKYAYP
jgi:hypothetical protein